MGQVTALLQQLTDGRRDALDELLPLVYEELHERAQRFLRYERAGHTLTPTALVHEAFLRLVDQRRVDWQNRAQFFAIASKAMRRILVDHARKRLSKARGADQALIRLGGERNPRTATAEEILEIDLALTKLASEYSRQAQVVELLFFGGLAQREIATIVGVSIPTVKRDWRFARAWLNQELQPI